MFRPKLIPTLITLPSLVLLIALGTWQTQRLFWKDSVIEEITQKATEDAIPLPDDIRSLDDFRYRKVKVTGNFLNDKEVHLYTGAIQFKGDTGYHILTPFKRDDTGTIIMVNRGWAPASYKDPETRKDTQINGRTTLTALVLDGETKPMPWLPDNDLSDNVWFWQDIPQMEGYTGLQLAPFMLLALTENATITVGQNGMSWAEMKTPQPPYPMASNGHISIRNDHLQYAITWYSMAVVLLVIFVVYHRKQ